MLSHFTTSSQSKPFLPIFSYEFQFFPSFSKQFLQDKRPNLPRSCTTSSPPCITFFYRQLTLNKKLPKLLFQCIGIRCEWNCKPYQQRGDLFSHGCSFPVYHSLVDTMKHYLYQTQANNAFLSPFLNLRHSATIHLHSHPQPHTIQYCVSTSI